MAPRRTWNKAGSTTTAPRPVPVRPRNREEEETQPRMPARTRSRSISPKSSHQSLKALFASHVPKHFISPIHAVPVFCVLGLGAAYFLFGAYPPPSPSPLLPPLSAKADSPEEKWVVHTEAELLPSKAEWKEAASDWRKGGKWKRKAEIEAEAEEKRRRKEKRKKKRQQEEEEKSKDQEPSEASESSNPASEEKESTVGRDSQKTESTELTESGCSCYRVRNDFCCFTGVCVCHNVCYNGSALLGPIKSFPCVKPVFPPRPQKGQVVSPVVPVICRQKKRFPQELRRALEENSFDSDILKHGLDFRDASWRESREGVTWHKGTSLFMHLDDSMGNIAHFWGKVGMMLVLNNCTGISPSLPYPVDRMFLPRCKDFQKWLARVKVEDSWQMNVLKAMLALVAGPHLGKEKGEALDEPDLNVDRLAGSGPLLDGYVQYESGVEGASEEKPICFDHVVLPGVLKAISFPSGPREARMFKDLLARVAHVEPPIPPERSKTDPVQVVYLKRKGPRRLFIPSSEASLLDLLGKLDFQVTAVDPGMLTFAEQMKLMMNADLIVGMHGAALMNAAFASNKSALVEIVPYRVVHHGYHFSSVSAGVTYAMHQCRQGVPQANDTQFEKLTQAQCTGIYDCKEYFTHHRDVELTNDDIADLEFLLKEVKQVILDNRRDVKWAGKRLKKRYNKPHFCKDTTWNQNCRVTMLHSPWADVKVECILRKQCDRK